MIGTLAELRSVEVVPAVAARRAAVARDEPEVLEGTFGELFLSLADRAGVEVVTDFDARLDSNGDLWPQRVRMAVRPGMRMGHLIQTPAAFVVARMIGEQATVSAFVDAGDVDAIAGPGLLITQDGMQIYDTGGARSIHLDGTNGDFSVNGNASIGGNVFVHGLLEVYGNPSLLIRGTTTMNGTLTINANLTVTGTTVLGGDLSLDGNLDAAGFKITGAEIEGSSLSTDGDGITITGDVITFAAGHNITFDSDDLIYNADGHLFHGSVVAANNLGVVGATSLAGNIGFFGTAPSGKPTITGSRASGAAVADLLSSLAALGLIVDNSTA